MARPPRATQYEERGWALRASGRSLARAGQRRADPDDFAVDVEARRRSGEADLASPGLLACQVADESSRHDHLHPARGFLAEGLPRSAASTPLRRTVVPATTRVAVDDGRRPGDLQRGGMTDGGRARLLPLARVPGGETASRGPRSAHHHRR